MKRRLIVPIVCTLCALFCVSCTVQAGRSIRGSGDVTEETHRVKGVTAVELASFGDLFIKLGNREGLRVEAEENLHKYFEIDVHRGKLEIRTRRHVNLRPKKPVRFYLTVKRLEAIHLSGCGDIEAPDLEGKKVRISLSGAGDIDAGELKAGEVVLKLSGAGDLAVDAVHADEVYIDLSGAGDVEVGHVDADEAEIEITGAGNADITRGNIERQDIRISGAGDYSARRVASDEADVMVSGCGSATIQVHDHLKAVVSGTGDVRYAGSPRVRASVTGVGDLEKI